MFNIYLFFNRCVFLPILFRPLLFTIIYGINSDGDGEDDDDNFITELLYLVDSLEILVKNILIIIIRDIKHLCRIFVIIEK